MLEIQAYCKYNQEQVYRFLIPQQERSTKMMDHHILIKLEYQILMLVKNIVKVMKGIIKELK